MARRGRLEHRRGGGEADAGRVLRAALSVPAHLGLPRWATRLLPVVEAAPLGPTGRPLSEVVFGVIDLETTGLSAATSEILEIGLVVLRHGLNTRRFQTLVRTDRTVPSAISALTGIREADLLGAPPEPQALEGLRSVLREERVEALVAHNARFDRSFLDAAWERHLLSPPLPPFLCTLRLARRLLRSPRYSLDVLAEHLSLLPRSRHRALGDAELAADLFREVLRRAVGRGVGSLEDLDSLQSSPVRAQATPQTVKVCGSEPL